MPQKMIAKINMEKQEKIKQIIDLLNDIDIDSETMEDILEEVGMRERVIHQILESEKYLAVKKLWDDVENNDTLWCSDFDSYYNYTFLENKSKNLTNIKNIPINIWDDFYDDGYAPEGEKLETYIYVEDTDILQEKTKEYLEILLEYINKNLNTDGVKLWLELYESRKKYPNLVGNPDAEKMFFDRWEIKVEGLTHRRLDAWMKVLENVHIESDGVPFYIYSSS